MGNDGKSKPNGLDFPDSGEYSAGFHCTGPLFWVPLSPPLSPLSPLPPLSPLSEPLSELLLATNL